MAQFVRRQEDQVLLGGELEITDTIQTLLTTGARVEVQRVQGWWKDTGRPENLLEANQLIQHELNPYNHGTIE